MVASIFLVGGFDAFMHPEGKAKKAEVVVSELTRQIPVLPDDAELLVKLNGAVQMAAGLLLGLGRMRRLAAAALIGSIIPTTLAGHRFWEEIDETDRAEQRVHFLKNLGLLGGLVLILSGR